LFFSGAVFFSTEVAFWGKLFPRIFFFHKFGQPGFGNIFGYFSQMYLVTLVASVTDFSAPPKSRNQRKISSEGISSADGLLQGCQMLNIFAYQKIPILVYLGRSRIPPLFVYFMATWCFFWEFGVFYDDFGIICGHLVHFFVFWYVGPRKI
jgi:hypothetical protein